MSKHGFPTIGLTKKEFEELADTSELQVYERLLHRANEASQAYETALAAVDEYERDWKEECKAVERERVSKTKITERTLTFEFPTVRDAEAFEDEVLCTRSQRTCDVMVSELEMDAVRDVARENGGVEVRRR